MNKDIVIIPLRVSREQRRLWKVDAAQRGISVQGMLMERLEGVGYKSPVVVSKPVSVEALEVSKWVEEVAIEPEGHRCWKCKEVVRVTTVDKLGHHWCKDCIEDQRNAIP